MSERTTTQFGHLSDKELIILIKEDQEYLGEVYKRGKSYSIQFMRKMTIGSKFDYDLEDIFQDAIIVLYEKIVAGNFELTCSLQTYLNAVCRNQLLKKMKKTNLTTEYEDYLDVDDDENPLSYGSNITDCLDEEEETQEDQRNAIEIALVKMKEAGGHCYELLILFWYHRKSMNELTQHFGYTNEVNTRNQKAKCQKRLKILAFNEMNH